MRPSDDSPFALSVILAAIDDYPTIAEALASAEEQTAVHDLEILLVVEDFARFAAPDDFKTRHPRVEVIDVGRPLLLHEARAIGVERARGEFVFLLEDHALPEPDCLQFILERIREGTWSVIGPAFRNANQRFSWGHAANLLTYGEWMGYTEGEERRFVAGFSSAWRRSDLERFSQTLVDDLAIPNRLQQRLRRVGARFYFEARARILHWEPSSRTDVSWILTQQGRGMGFVRRGAGALPGKLGASLLWPGLAAYRAARGIRAALRKGDVSPRLFARVAWLAVVWSSAELVGSWSSDGDLCLSGVSTVERQRQTVIDGDAEPIERPWG